MPWLEFKQMLIGIDNKTTLGRIIAIRAEDDKEVLKTFTKEQHRIRNEWRQKHAKMLANSTSREEIDAAVDGFKNAFLHMAGLGGDQKLKS